MRLKSWILPLICVVGGMNSVCAKAPKSKVVSVQDLFSQTTEAYQKRKWKDVDKLSSKILKEFPDTPFASDLFFYKGVSFFNLREFEYANEAFSKYLNDYSSPKFFEEVIGYKFKIAKSFETGSKKHIMGLRVMPKWLPAREEAIEIYDQVIASLPRSELAAQSLYRKGHLQFELDKNKESIEVFQSLIRRFPKHPLAPESYVSISKVYLKECEKKYPDPEKLELARINLRNFRKDFPSEPRIYDVQKALRKMRDRFASEYWATAQFYEKRKRPDSAIIYYRTIVMQYPKSTHAKHARDRLAQLKPKYTELKDLFEIDEAGILVNNDE